VRPRAGRSDGGQCYPTGGVGGLLEGAGTRQGGSHLMASHIDASEVTGQSTKSLLHASLDAFEVTGHCTKSLLFAGLNTRRQI
jgi:hypothetical protein